jgi:TPP-dependent 2-oxoacid decarboxylase
MTAQEVSSMLRWAADPIILLANNASYVIEEMIHRGGYNALQVGDIRVSLVTVGVTSDDAV